MMRIENHLEQISLSATAISELPFPPPRIFTNALLHPHDITALIRDTEAHERALFTVTPVATGSFEPATRFTHRSVDYGQSPIGEASNGRTGSYLGPQSDSNVRMVLGGDMLDQIRRSGTSEGRDKAEADVDLLLKGGERLCRVYPVEGAMERISSLRIRYERLSSSVARYESRVARQARQLDKMNHPKDYAEDPENSDTETELTVIEEPHVLDQAEGPLEALRREEEEMRELQKKKRGLEDRVSGMERDLGGLLG